MSDKHYPCGECGEPVPVDLKKRIHSGQIEENYIRCPHCQFEFISYVTDVHARNEQKKIKKLHEEYWSRRNKLSERMEKLKNKILEQKTLL